MVDKATAQAMIAGVGGPDNVRGLVHCATRLRFDLIDRSRADQDTLGAIAGVQGVVSRSGQLQLVIGQGDVEEYYEVTSQALEESRAEPATPGSPELQQKEARWSPRALLDRLLATLSAIFAPVIPAIVGCGMIMGLLYSMQLLGWIDAASPWYQLLNTVANAAFYFLPIYLAFSSGQRFGANPFVAAVLGGVLLHPVFIGLTQEGAGLLDLGVFSIALRDYSSTVVPIILTVYFMSWVERGMRRITPKMISLIVVPTVSILVSAIVGLWIIAPAGAVVGDVIASGFMGLYSDYGIIGGVLLGALYPFILGTGMQVAFVPIIVMNLQSAGHDVIYPLIAASNSAMAAAALFVLVRARDKKLKELAGSVGISALIGVTEPVFFGLVVRFRKVLVAVMAGGAAGGAVMGAFQVTYAGFGFVPFGTIILALGPTFGMYLLGVAAAMGTTVAVLLVTGYDSAPTSDTPASRDTSGEADAGVDTAGVVR